MTDEPTLGGGTLAWVATLCGTTQLVARGPLSGGAMGRVWSVTVGGAAQPTIALKEFPRHVWGDYAEEVVAGEAFALGVGLPRAPALLGADPRALHCDEPVVAMEWANGQTKLAPPGELDDWLRPMAALLAEVHGTDVSGRGLPEIPYRSRSFEVPRWATDPDAWRRVFDRVEGTSPPGTGRVLVHSDFHPGNILWKNGEVAALLDWTYAGVGAPEWDLAHCRTSLALLAGPSAADLFIELYGELRPGPDNFQRWYDVVDALVFLPDPLDRWHWHAFGRPDLTRELMRARLEEFVLGPSGPGQSSSSGTGS